MSPSCSSRGLWAFAALALGAAPLLTARAEGDALISVEHSGTLREVLQAIAREGNINLVVTGPLDEPAEIYLRQVTAAQALQTVAEGWGLQLERKGTIWTVRPRPGQAAAPPTPPAPSPLSLAPGSDGAQARERSQRALESLRAPAAGPVDDAPAETGGHRVVFGRSLRIAPGEAVDKAVVYGGSLAVEGTVRGDAVAFGGSVDLGPSARVGGNAVAFGGSVQRAPGAVVGGNVQTFGGSVHEPNAAAVVKPERKGRPVPASRPRAQVADFLIWFALLFGLGFAASMIAPARMKVVQDEIRRAPGRSTFTGLLGLFALPVVTVLLLVTVVLIPVAVVLLLPAAALAAGVGFTAVAAELGRRLPVMRGRKTQALVLALGLLFILLVARLPVLGVLLVLLFGLCGFGAVLRTRFGSRPRAPSSVLQDNLPTGMAV